MFAAKDSGARPCKCKRGLSPLTEGLDPTFRGAECGGREEGHLVLLEGPTLSSQLCGRLGSTPEWHGFP